MSVRFKSEIRFGKIRKETETETL